MICRPVLTRRGHSHCRNLSYVSNHDNHVHTEVVRAVIERGAGFRFHVSGHSMHPFIRNGDEVVIAPMSSSGPRRGDVVLAIHPHNKNPVVHRIVNKQGPCYLLQGDNRLFADGLVRKENILGKAISVDRNGKTTSMGLGHEGLIIGVLVRTGLFLPLKRGVSIILHSSPDKSP